MTARRQRVAPAVAVVAALGAAFVAGYLATSQARAVDFLFFRVQPARACTLVAVDQRSYRELLPQHGAMGNWPRALYAQALARLGGLGPRVIVLDIFFDAARPDDGELVAVMRRLGKRADAGRGRGAESRAAGARRRPGVRRQTPRNLAGRFSLNAATPSA